MQFQKHFYNLLDPICEVKDENSKKTIECIIPFVFLNTTFHGCTDWLDKKSKTTPWCSTKVNPVTKEHIGGEENYGNCPKECFVDEKPQPVLEKDNKVADFQSKTTTENIINVENLGDYSNNDYSNEETNQDEQLQGGP